jgi:predicted RNA-binding Zn-ribbon protein involved in translation (DUF1610 family)
MFIRGGGTSTSANDKAIAEAEADAERRRDEALAEREMTRLPVEAGGARIFENKSLDPGAKDLHVLLDLVNAKGEPHLVAGVPIQCLADIRVVGPNEMAVVVVCPRCINRKIPQGQCQIQVRQSNRNWHLSDKGRGSPLWFDGKMYQSAGTIMDSDRFSCPNCAWSARIDNNKLRAE